MLSVQLSTPFLLLAVFASFGTVLPAPTNNKPVPTCFTSKIDLSVKWPVTLTAQGATPVTACNGTVLGNVDDAGLLALKTARVGTLPNNLEVYMPNSTCFLPVSSTSDEVQTEAIGTAFSALSTRSVPCGTTLFIPALEGVVLPKGAGVHNGCVRAVNRQAEIKSKCEGVLNVGSEANAALLANVTGETAIQIKNCVPNTYTALSLVSTAGGEDSEDESEEFDYPDPTTSSQAASTSGQDNSASHMTLVSTNSQSESEEDSEDASYSLEEDSGDASEAGSVDQSASAPATSSNSGSTIMDPTTASSGSKSDASEDIEYVDCDENGNPISSGSSAGSTSGSVQYVYVDCDENGNPIAGSNTSSGSDDEIEYVDCDENGNPIVNGSSSSDDIEYVDCDENGNPIVNGSSSSSDDIEYVDCDENGNPITQ